MNIPLPRRLLAEFLGAAFLAARLTQLTPACASITTSCTYRVRSTYR
jgi:hypothetical protein